MLEVLPPTPEVEKILDAAGKRAQGKPVVQQERLAGTLSRVVWDPAQQPAEGAAPKLPAWAALDPGTQKQEDKACFESKR